MQLDIHALALGNLDPAQQISISLLGLLLSSERLPHRLSNRWRLAAGQRKLVKLFARGRLHQERFAPMKMVPDRRVVGCQVWRTRDHGLVERHQGFRQLDGPHAQHGFGWVNEHAHEAWG
jgi:hypothetical protein